jgi:hypothetical protein
MVEGVRGGERRRGDLEGVLLLAVLLLCVEKYLVESLNIKYKNRFWKGRSSTSWYKVSLGVIEGEEKEDKEEEEEEEGEEGG